MRRPILITRTVATGGVTQMRRRRPFIGRIGSHTQTLDMSSCHRSRNTQLSLLFASTPHYIISEKFKSIALSHALFSFTRCHPPPPQVIRWPLGTVPRSMSTAPFPPPPPPPLSYCKIVLAAHAQCPLFSFGGTVRTAPQDPNRCFTTMIEQHT